jgi:LCP family protein required for cell wall assembly
MKLFGSNNKSRHSSGGKHVAKGGSGKQQTNGKTSPKKKTNIFVKIIVIFLLICAALAVAGFAYYKTAVKPPDVSSGKNSLTSIISGNKDTSEEAPSLSTSEDGKTSERSGDKYTFAVLGMDDGNGNTDTIMVGTFDTNDYTLEIVSIPRDTMVNVSWNVKKANTFYSNGGAEGVVEGLSNLLGYDVDFYAIIDLDAFEKIIDGIGGVTYDVPQNMNYSDPAQNLYINLQKGTQTLNGEQAMWIMRFRSTYAAGDIKRIEVQQDFLKTALSQILSNTSAIPVTTLADIVMNDVETNLTYGNIIWFAKELFKMDAENVNFHTLPGNTGDYVHQGTQNVSYVTIYVDEWLEMINEYLNPFDEPIELSDLDILTRNSSGALYATSGVRQGSSSWGSSSSSSSSSSSKNTTSSGSSSTTNKNTTGTTNKNTTGTTTTTTTDTTNTTGSDTTTNTTTPSDTTGTNTDNENTGSTEGETAGDGNEDTTGSSGEQDNETTQTPSEGGNTDTSETPSTPSTPAENGNENSQTSSETTNTTTTTTTTTTETQTEATASEE